MGDHANIDRARKAIEAFQRRDIEAMRDWFADDVVWHVPGTSSISGEYKGIEETFALFKRLAEETNGTFQNPLHDTLANGEHIVTMHDVTGERKGKRLDQRLINIFHVNAEGRVNERWAFAEDQSAFDEFWA